MKGVLAIVMYDFNTSTIMQTKLRIICKTKINSNQFESKHPNLPTLAVTLLYGDRIFPLWLGYQLFPTFYLSISQLEIWFKAISTVRRYIQLVYVVQSLINPVIYSLRLPAFSTRRGQSLTKRVKKVSTQGKDNQQPKLKWPVLQ